MVSFATLYASEWVFCVIKKHPDPSPVTPTCLISPDAPVLGSYNPVIFDCLDGDLICCNAVHVEGSPGSLEVDALGWRYLSLSQPNFPMHFTLLQKKQFN